MKVTVEYMAQIKHATGVDSETIELRSPCRPEELVPRLAERHGEALRKLLLDPEDRLNPAILLFVNGNQVRENGTVLEEGDVVTLLSPMAGGEA